MHNQNIALDDPMLRIPDVVLQVGLKKSTIYDLIKKGEFPQPIRLGGRASGWLSSEIRDWKQRKIEESRAKPHP